MTREKNKSSALCVNCNKKLDGEGSIECTLCEERMHSNCSGLKKDEIDVITHKNIWYVCNSCESTKGRHKELHKEINLGKNLEECKKDMADMENKIEIQEIENLTEEYTTKGDNLAEYVNDEILEDKRAQKYDLFTRHKEKKRLNSTLNESEKSSPECPVPLKKIKLEPDENCAIYCEVSIQQTEPEGNKNSYDEEFLPDIWQKSPRSKTEKLGLQNANSRVPSSNHDSQASVTTFTKFEGLTSNSYMLMDVNEYVYQLNKKSDTRTFIRCFRKDCPVRGTLSLSGEEMKLDMRQKHNHSCDDEHEYIEKCLLLKAIKNRVRNEEISIRTIYDEETCKHPGVIFPPFRKISATLWKIRASLRPKLPKTFQECVEGAKEFLKKKLANTCPFEVLSTAVPDGNKTHNLIFLPDGDPTHNLIFLPIGKRRQTLESAETIFVDATFSVVPKFFLQLLTIHIPVMDHIFPVAYILMKGKSRIAYRSVFDELRKIMPAFNPQTSMSDFETGLTDALKMSFPGMTCLGCWFHFCQAVWRKTQELGLVQFFKINAEVKKIMKMIMAIPLLPAAKFEEGFEFIDANIKNLPAQTLTKMRNLCVYVKDDWVNEVTPNRMSVYGQNRRIDNDVESFYAMMKTKFGKDHQNFYKFIEKMADIDIAKSIEECQLREGKQIPRTKSRVKQENEKNIKTSSTLLNTGELSVGDFLNRVKDALPAAYENGNNGDRLQDLDPVDNI